MIPTTRAILLLALGFPIALLPAMVAPQWWPVWMAFLTACLLLVGLDGVLLVSPRAMRMRQRAPVTLYVGDTDPLDIDLSVASGRLPNGVDVQAELVGDLQPQPAQVTPSDGDALHTSVSIPLTPTRRGRVRVDAVWLRWRGPLGLMRRIQRRPIDLSLPVVPNVRAVRSMALRFFTNREFLAGLKTQHYIGDGSEFESLREYLPGWDPRALDWKASARHRKLLVRDFRAERNHQVFLAFDTGHLMSEPLGGIPRLDHAINAGLLLGYVCLKTGDRVGMFAFDHEVRLFAEPQGGVQGLQKMQMLTSDIDYGTSETNFTLGLTDLLTRLHRRSLVIVFTDFVDTVTAELMVENLHRLARRHLVIFVTFRDQTLDGLVDQPPLDLNRLNEAVVADDFRREREVVLRRLGRQGVSCIEAPANEISTRLINRYLEIKRREMV